MLIDTQAAIARLKSGQVVYAYGISRGTFRVKAIGDTMKERNIAPYVLDDYISISHPSTYRGLKNSLETLHQYTETGIAHTE